MLSRSESGSALKQQIHHQQQSGNILPSIYSSSSNGDIFNHSSLQSRDKFHLEPISNHDRHVARSRYKVSDWSEAVVKNTNLAEKELGQAVGIRFEVINAIKSTELKTRKRQASNTRKLADRASDIASWKNELDAAVEADENEMEMMNNCIKALEQAMEDTRTPLRSVMDSLAQRNKRTGVDKVQDEVERMLVKEISIIKKCQERLGQMVERSRNQQNQTRSAQNACDMDSKHKHHAHELDAKMQKLRNTSSEIGLFPNIEKIDNTVSVPASWLKFTQDNLARSHYERQASMKLRAEIGACLSACAADMAKISNSSHSVLDGRLQDVIDARNKMQEHLTKTINEIKKIEQVIMMLRRAIYDKEAPLKVAQTRLEERSRRLDVELCNDPSMQGLQVEIQEIRESIRLLRSKLMEAEDSLARLLKTRSILANDIQEKERSIEIDSKAAKGMKLNRYTTNQRNSSVGM